MGTKNYYSFIYQLLFSDGKSFIGSTMNAAAIYGSHKYAASRPNAKSPMYDAWRTLGAPELKILERCSPSDATQRLKASIHKFNSVWPQGYNVAASRNAQASLLKKYRKESSLVHTPSPRTLTPAERRAQFIERFG